MANSTAQVFVSIFHNHQIMPPKIKNTHLPLQLLEELCKHRLSTNPGVLIPAIPAIPWNNEAHHLLMRLWELIFPKYSITLSHNRYYLILLWEDYFCESYWEYNSNVGKSIQGSITPFLQGIKRQLETLNNYKPAFMRLYEPTELDLEQEARQKMSYLTTCATTLPAGKGTPLGQGLAPVDKFGIPAVLEKTFEYLLAAQK